MTFPVYLTCPVWAPTYVQRFAEWCLASLLAPGNLPALGGRPCVFLCATRREDWAGILAHPLVRQAQGFAEFRPVFFEGTNLPQETGTMTFARSQRMMFDIAHAAGAATIVFCADRIWADGDLSRLVAMAGAPPLRMVLAPGFRMNMEAVLPNLALGGALSLSNRRLAALTMEFMHGSYRVYDADAPMCGDDMMGYVFWRAAPDGAVWHTLNWEPVLIDFSHPWPHDARCLLDWPIDGPYAWWNCWKPEHWRGVTDSDEHVFTSPTPEWPMQPSSLSISVAEAFQRIRGHREADPLRQACTALSYRMHGSPIVDEGWAVANERAAVCERDSRVEIRERWSTTQEAMPYRFVASGPYRDVVMVHGRVYSFEKSHEPNLMLRIFKDGVQPHGGLEEALRACHIQQ
jgi:hypothetical protein